MRRAICGRCGKPLAIFPDFDDGQYRWTCNVRQDDKAFAKVWAKLTPGDRDRLKAKHPEMDAA